MKTLFALAALLTALAAGGIETVFQCDFNVPDSIRSWSAPANMTYLPDGGRNGSGGLRFVNKNPKGMVIATLPLDIEKLRGRGVMLEGWIRAENVSATTIHYHGPKLMLIITNQDGKKEYPDQPKVYGSHDWKKFTVFARVSKNAKAAALVLGLEGVSGTVFFDDLRMTLEPLSAGWKQVPNGLPVQKKTRFRGVMSGYDLSEAAFRELKEVWNANLMRFQIVKRRGEDNSTVEGYRKIVARGLKSLDGILPLARKYGIRIVLDMHVAPGSKVDGLLSNQLSYDPEMQEELVNTWRMIAGKYRNDPVFYGYDILNEPREDRYVYKAGGGIGWNALARKIALAIREVDPQIPVIVEAAPWGGADALAEFVPIGVPRIIYSFHFYGPSYFTHQGIGFRPLGTTYPGTFDGICWDRTQLEKAMRHPIEFQKRYNVPIYVGEFGVVRWAENGEQWLKDMISIFEKYGWDWTFHAFREWDGWDAEMGPDSKDRTRIGDTPRRRVLIRAMKQNKSSSAQ